MITTIYDSNRPMPQGLSNATADFLYLHLGHYGDPREDIRKAIGYALQETESDGGFVCLATEEDTILGATVINRTGMESYIPENILVYIAVHNQYRGQGIGRRIMQTAINHVQGAIALHVEPDNPAKKLYEDLGFTNKYLEMRLDRKEVL